MDVLIAIVVGLGSGLTASVIFWYLQFRVFRVRLKLSETLAHYQVAGDPAPRYQVKIQNVGRRDAIDLEVRISIAIRGLVRRNYTELMSLEYWHRARLDKGKPAAYLIAPSRIIASSRRWYARHLPHDVQEALASEAPFDLQRILDVGSAAEIRIYVFGTDELSGARSLFSGVYTQDDFRTGAFIKGTFDHTGSFLDEDVIDEAGEVHGAPRLATDSSGPLPGSSRTAETSLTSEPSDTLEGTSSTPEEPA